MSLYLRIHKLYGNFKWARKFKLAPQEALPVARYEAEELRKFAKSQGATTKRMHDMVAVPLAIEFIYWRYLPWRAM